MTRPFVQISAAHIERRGRIHQRLMRKFFVRNYIIHVVDGGFFMAGLAFLSVTVVLPDIIRSLNGPQFAIAAMPVIMMIGYQLPPIFTAHHIERVKRHIPMLMILGVFQRLPYLITGLVLWFSRHDPPGWAWILVALTPLASALCGGCGFPAWVEMLANTIPSNRRPSMASLRQMIAAISGIGCGMAVKYILKTFPGCGGIGILHLVCFCFTAASWLSFSQLREVPNPRPRVMEKTSLAAALGQLPQLLKNAPQIRLYLVEICLGATPLIMASFMAIHALDVLGKPQPYVGELLSVMMIGNVTANIFAGYIGDRFGAKKLFWIAKTALITSCLLLPEAQQPWHFQALFIVFGFATVMQHIAVQTTNMDIVPLENRLRYFSIMSLAGLAGMLSVPLISTGLNHISGGNFRYLAYATLAAQLVSLTVIYRLPDLRKQQQETQA